MKKMKILARLMCHTCMVLTILDDAQDMIGQDSCERVSIRK